MLAEVRGRGKRSILVNQLDWIQRIYRPDPLALGTTESNNEDGNIAAIEISNRRVGRASAGKANAGISMAVWRGSATVLAVETLGKSCRRGGGRIRGVVHLGDRLGRGLVEDGIFLKVSGQDRRGCALSEKSQ